MDDQDDYDVEIMADDWMEHVGQMPETKANLWTIWPNAPSEVIEELWQRLSELHGIAGFLQKIPHQNTSNAMDLSNLKPGYRPIPGKPYELTKELGQGGFGAVWKGKNEKLGRFFVFKFCNEPLNPTKLISLHNELRLVSKLNHPEIVQLHDEYLELKPPYLPCLIYDFVEGVDLHTVLAERKKQERSLSVEEATGLILKIAEIIAYVHSHPEKIVHRDLKPANILVTNLHDLALLSAIGGHADLRLARLKVMDFGIGARSSHGRDSASRMNSYGIAFDGFRSEGYASPQQERGEPATECDDVYALGAMWQQFLMGHVPRGTGWNRTLQKKQMTEKQIQVVEACMEDDCDHRIPNAKAMAEKIRSTMPNAALTDSFEESFRKACLAVGEDTEIQIKDLTVDSAALLAANWEHPTLSLPKLESLSIEAAEKLTTWEGDSLQLDGLTSLSPETAEKLATWKGRDLELNGLISLGPETAEKLATWNGWDLELNGLESLSPEIAEKLATWKGWHLHLNGLTSLSPETAEKLATWEFKNLYLGLKSLSPEIAEKLATWKGRHLHLNGLTSLSPETAEKLATWEFKNLYLGLKSLSPEIAETLATWKGWHLHLNGLKSLSPETAEKLATWEFKKLDLGLKSLSPEIAEKLATWKGRDLHLTDLESLTPEIAEKLATWEFKKLDLGLKSLSPETAEKLATWKGESLHLNGLKSLSPETAEKLATWNGWDLELNGLESLSPEIAEKLATWEGTSLDLSGLESLSPEIAEKLATWEGNSLHLSGLESLTPEIAEPFVMWRGYGIYLNGIEKFSRQTAEALFWKAAEAGGWALAKALLTDLLEVDFAKICGNKVLFMAVKADRKDVIDHLRFEIEGYSPNLSITLAETGDTLLHLAAKLGHHKVVKLLLRAGAKPQGKNKEGKTVLQCAMDSGSMETVRLLVPKDL